MLFDFPNLQKHHLIYGSMLTVVYSVVWFIPHFASASLIYRKCEAKQTQANGVNQPLLFKFNLTWFLLIGVNKVSRRAFACNAFKCILKFNNIGRARPSIDPSQLRRMVPFDPDYRCRRQAAVLWTLAYEYRPEITLFNKIIFRDVFFFLDWSIELAFIRCAARRMGYNARQLRDPLSPHSISFCFFTPTHPFLCTAPFRRQWRGRVCMSRVCLYVCVFRPPIRLSMIGRHEGALLAAIVTVSIASLV